MYSLSEIRREPHRPPVQGGDRVDEIHDRHVLTATQHELVHENRQGTCEPEVTRSFSIGGGRQRGLATSRGPDPH